jgi:hypothetical protein
MTRLLRKAPAAMARAKSALDSNIWPRAYEFDMEWRHSS